MTKYIMFGSAIIIALMSAVIWYQSNKIDGLNQDVATEKSNVVRLIDINKKQNESIKRLDDARAKDQVKMDALSAENVLARREAEDLKNKFRKHDLNELSIRKPGLIENIINKGTKNVLNEFEELTK